MDSVPLREPLAATRRLLAEGIRPLAEAAQSAGLQPVPSAKTLRRAALSGRLESLLVAGRRVTSSLAVVRWIALEQQRRGTHL